MLELPQFLDALLLRFGQRFAWLLVGTSTGRCSLRGAEFPLQTRILRWLPCGLRHPGQ
jgi:hypothetical protein